MKKNHLLQLLIAFLLFQSCDYSTENEKKAREYMSQIVYNTNTKANLPNRIDDYTIAEKVKYNSETKTIIYSYIINKEDYGNDNEFKTAFDKIKSDQIALAVENQGKDKYYQILGVTIKSIYKSDSGQVLYEFDIEPKAYLANLQVKYISNNNSDVIFSKSNFDVNFSQGLDYEIEGKHSNATGEWEKSAILKSNTYTLNFLTDIKNPFDVPIENSNIYIELELKYQAGQIKYKSKKHRDYLSWDEELKHYDVSDFFKGKTITLTDLQKYSEYLDVMSSYIMPSNSSQKDIDFNNKEKKSVTYYDYGYTDKELRDLKNSLTEFEKYFKSSNQYKYFTDILNAEYNPNFLTEKSNYCLRIFNDFEFLESQSTMKQIPTINLFKADNVKLHIYVDASNTNGFTFSDKIRTIDITNNWNNYFVKTPPFAN